MSFSDRDGFISLHPCTMATAFLRVSVPMKPSIQEPVSFV